MDTKITQAQFVDDVARRSNNTSKDVRDILKAAGDEIIDYAKHGWSVPFASLGTFKPVDRAAKTGRNPQTGEAIKIPARRVLVFKPSSKVDLNK